MSGGTIVWLRQDLRLRDNPALHAATSLGPAHHLLCHFPHTPLQPLQPELGKFPWQRNAPGLRAWQQGRTGIPMVDAGMRELWATGWMHNRVRMIVASLLVKNLLVPWQEGARWFWDTLVDADLANNTMNWQWVAGSGADAAPYFRIFNPVTQAKRFDPAGSYIRKVGAGACRRPRPLRILSSTDCRPAGLARARSGRVQVPPGQTPPTLRLRLARYHGSCSSPTWTNTTNPEASFGAVPLDAYQEMRRM